MIVVNAATIDNDFAVIRERLTGGEFRDVSTETAKLDLQGPLSREVLVKAVRPRGRRTTLLQVHQDGCSRRAGDRQPDRLYRRTRLRDIPPRRKGAGTVGPPPGRRAGETGRARGARRAPARGRVQPVRERHRRGHHAAGGGACRLRQLRQRVRRAARRCCASSRKGCPGSRWPSG